MKACLERMKAQQVKRDGFCIFLTCMGLMLDGNDGRPMKDIGDKFYEILLLCLPLLEAQVTSQPELIVQMERNTELLVQSLEQKDGSVYAETLKSVMNLAESTARQLFSQV